MKLNNTMKILIVVLVLVLAVGVWGLRQYLDSRGGLTGSGTSNNDAASLAFITDSFDLAQWKSAKQPILINFAGDG